MKQKPLIPSLREKKRYVAYEVISDSDFDAKEVSAKIADSFKDLFGDKGLADAGLIFLDDKFDKKTKRGLVRVSHDSLDDLRSSFVFIRDINGKRSIVRSVIASGMIAKAENVLSAS